MKKTEGKNAYGVTLIALIVTVIVILILAAIVVNTAINGGLFIYARKTGKESNYYKEKEKAQTIYTETLKDRYSNDDKSFRQEIENEFGLETTVEKNDDGTYKITLENGDEITAGNPINKDTIAGEDEIVVPEDIQSENLTDNYQFKVCGYDISLSGDITTVIYFEIPEAMFSNSQKTIRISNANRTGTTATFEIQVTKEKFTKKTVKIGNENKEVYCARYEQVPKEVDDNITVCAYDESTPISDVYNFTMNDIGRALVDKINNVKVKNYINSLLDYGHYTRVFLNYNNPGEPTYTNSLSEAIKAAERITYRNVDYIITFDTNYVNNTTVNVLSENRQTLSGGFYRKNSNENVVIKCNDREVPMVKGFIGGLISGKQEVFLEDFDVMYEFKAYNSNNEEIGCINYSMTKKLFDMTQVNERI